MGQPPRSVVNFVLLQHGGQHFFASDNDGNKKGIILAWRQSNIRPIDADAVVVVEVPFETRNLVAALCVVVVLTYSTAFSFT